jgi:hypothetical protein
MGDRGSGSDKDGMLFTVPFQSYLDAEGAQNHRSWPGNMRCSFEAGENVGDGINGTPQG